MLVSRPIRIATRHICAGSFVGSGFAGMEGFCEPLSFAITPLSFCPTLQSNYRLPLGRSTTARSLPEVSESTAATVCARSNSAAHIHLNRQIPSAADDHVVPQASTSSIQISLSGQRATRPSQQPHVDHSCGVLFQIKVSELLLDNARSGNWIHSPRKMHSRQCVRKRRNMTVQALKLALMGVRPTGTER